MHMTIVTPIPTSRGYCTLLAGLAHSTHEQWPIDYVLLDNGKYCCALKYPKQQHRYLLSLDLVIAIEAASYLCVFHGDGLQTTWLRLLSLEAVYTACM